MGTENMMPSGFWIIPMAICMIFMIIMMFTRMRTGMPGGFMHWHGLSNTGKNAESPLEIINKRYAKGEISQSEYLQLKSDLIE